MQTNMLDIPRTIFHWHIYHVSLSYDKAFLNHLCSPHTCPTYVCVCINGFIGTSASVAICVYDWVLLLISSLIWSVQLVSPKWWFDIVSSDVLKGIILPSMSNAPLNYHIHNFTLIVYITELCTCSVVMFEGLFATQLHTFTFKAKEICNILEGRLQNNETLL
jgi:hypothetical protein